MKIILLNPPGGSHYDGPMMGIPAVVGQLKKRGFRSVTQLDLDLELYYHARKPQTCKKICSIIRSGGFHRPGGLLAKLFGPLLLRILASRVLREREALDAYRSATPLDRQFPEKGLLDYKKGVNRVLKLMAVYFYPYLAYPRFFSFREKKVFQRVHLRIGNQLSKHFGHGKKILTAFYETELLPRLKEEAFDVIGISVSFKRQLEPALLLAEVIDKHGIEARIVLGGSYITTTLDAGWLEESILDCADFAITSEGEEAFADLLDCLKSGGDLQSVPNLIYRRDGEKVVNKRSTIGELNALDPPDYEALPLQRYLERPVRLPLMTCRGCYWGKCTYCSHHWTLGSGRLRIRDPEKLFEDIRTFSEKYGVRSLYFTDEAVHPATMEALAQKIVDAGLDVRWVGMLRFDECVNDEFLELMRASGCHAILFGLESVSKHAQEIINKGIDLDRARRALESCRTLNIKVHLFIILGIPGEREEDMEANINFLLDHTDLYETVQLAPFQLMKGSPMFRNPSKFGIHNIETVSLTGQKAFSEVRFETSKGLRRADIDRYVSLLSNNKILFKKDLWEGFGFRIYREGPTIQETT